jgi:hypothetical protein
METNRASPHMIWPKFKRSVEKCPKLFKFISALTNIEKTAFMENTAEQTATNDEQVAVNYRDVGWSVEQSYRQLKKDGQR